MPVHRQVGYSTMDGVHGSRSRFSHKIEKKKRHPWGNQSYAELIEEAILASPTKKLLLQDIYEYFEQRQNFVTYEEGGKAFQGWKVSLKSNSILLPLLIQFTVQELLTHF